MNTPKNLDRTTNILTMRPPIHVEHLPILVIGMLITLVFALSIHVVMLQALAIPFPDYGDINTWAKVMNYVLIYFCLIVFYDLIRPHLNEYSVIRRCGFLFAIFIMLREMTRGLVMGGVVTSAWLYGIVQVLPSFLKALLLSVFIVFASPTLKSRGAKLLAACIIALVMAFIVRPLIAEGFAPLLRSLAYLDHKDIYPFPYPWQVLLPAYITYAEPVIACMGMAST